MTGTMTSSRPLFVTADSGADCQFGGRRLGVDSRTKPMDGRGQERVRVELLLTMERAGPVETQVFSSTETYSAVSS